MDERGFFSEVFNQEVMSSIGIELAWVQDNHSLSTQSGVVRGLHFQTQPKAQAKLLRVVRGAIFDVVVDLRKQSSTYGQHVSVELSADNWQQILVPIGCAHGFCTISTHTEVIYKVSNGYSPDHEGGLLWHDPALGIDWPISPGDALVSPRDTLWPRFNEFNSPF
ncbi:dTDP-4-dehydrorhamnose 3,5-epimerase [Candidatus Phycosocius spiralis]|uniref:dTDP-4-dehydrorhamnose 3,5-epimerase n=2 Tax=Candidatus Phycosocius spiralis TaxID=2815099 RepID=A0ABQ4PUH6_9PROT|nr:dTDP-4-dehydrorhamnose 3,5-epimerase [Candidatus Phycosocius spiralis]